MSSHATLDYLLLLAKTVSPLNRKCGKRAKQVHLDSHVLGMYTLPAATMHGQNCLPTQPDWSLPRYRLLLRCGAREIKIEGTRSVTTGKPMSVLFVGDRGEMDYGQPYYRLVDYNERRHARRLLNMVKQLNWGGPE